MVAGGCLLHLLAYLCFFEGSRQYPGKPQNAIWPSSRPAQMQMLPVPKAEVRQFCRWPSIVVTLGYWYNAQPEHPPCSGQAGPPFSVAFSLCARMRMYEPVIFHLRG